MLAEHSAREEEGLHIQDKELVEKYIYIYIYRIYLLQRRVNQKHETIMQRACIEGVREYNICTYVRILYGICMDNMVYIYIYKQAYASNIIYALKSAGVCVYIIYVCVFLITRNIRCRKMRYYIRR